MAKQTFLTDEDKKELEEKIEKASQSGGNGGGTTGSGLTTAQINALDGMFKVCAFTKPDVSAEYNAFKTAFGIGGGEEPDVPDVPDVPDEPDEPETGVSNETTWTDGVTYTFDWVENEYVSDGDGVFKKYEGWNRSPMLYCAGASRIDFVGANSQQANYNALYDADKQYVQDFRPSTNGYIDIPEGAVYFAVSGPSAVTQNFTATPRA